MSRKQLIPHICPKCKTSVTRVVDTRPTKDGITRRRRVCQGCKARLTTYEIIAQASEAGAKRRACDLYDVARTLLSAMTGKGLRLYVQFGDRCIELTADQAVRYVQGPIQFRRKALKDGVLTG